MTTSENPASSSSAPAVPPTPAMPPDAQGTQWLDGAFPPPPGFPAGRPAAPGQEQYARPSGPIGQVRPTGLTMLLFFVTLGIWGFVYYYQAQAEMGRHSGTGLGGVLALLISIFFGIVSPFLLSNEVGGLYERSGRQPPVTALTALWFFPGMLILVGPFVWFVRTNNALNDYWRGLGAR
jgi:uncharacterized protein DUF4234